MLAIKSATVLAYLACAGALADGGVLTVRQALQALQGLRGLDGHQVIVKMNGQDTAIMKSWEFNSGPLRLAIANDLGILTQVEQTTEKARTALIKSIAKDGITIEPNTADYAKFLQEWEKLLDAPAPLTGAITKLNAQELRLDVNEIPGSTLSALIPILKQ